MKRDARRVAVIAVAAAAALSLAACKGNKGGGGANDVAATVNGKNIMLSEIDRVVGQQTGGQQAALSPLELGGARLQILDDLIKQEVLFQRAEKEKLLPTDDELNQLITQEKTAAGTAEAYQNALKAAGQTEEQRKELARKQLAVQKLLTRYGDKVGVPSDKEVEDFYNNNRQRYVSARGVELAAIFVDPRDNGATNDAKNDADAQAKINMIHTRLKSGGDFATIAREQSEDPQTYLRGGDIGFGTEEDLKRTGFPAELVGKFFSSEMQAGDITAPFKGSDGRWSIFKLTSRRLQSENLTLENPEVKKDAADTITNQRKQLVSAALLEVALREAKIENKLAESMLNSASSLSSQRPAGAATPAPAQTASPAASPAAPSSPASNNNGAGKAGNANAGAANSNGAGKSGAAANANK